MLMSRAVTGYRQPRGQRSLSVHHYLYRLRHCAATDVATTTATATATAAATATATAAAIATATAAGSSIDICAFTELSPAQPTASALSSVVNSSLQRRSHRFGPGSPRPAVPPTSSSGHRPTPERAKRRTRDDDPLLRLAARVGKQTEKRRISESGRPTYAAL